MADPPGRSMRDRFRALEGVGGDPLDMSHAPLAVDGGGLPFVRCPTCGTDSHRSAVACPNCDADLRTAQAQAFNLRLAEQRKAEDAQLEAETARLAESQRQAEREQLEERSTRFAQLSRNAAEAGLGEADEQRLVEAITTHRGFGRVGGEAGISLLGLLYRSVPFSVWGALIATAFATAIVLKVVHDRRYWLALVITLACLPGVLLGSRAERGKRE